MKKVVALLLAVVLLLSLMTACSKNAGNSDVEETGDEQITISFMHQWNDEARLPY